MFNWNYKRFPEPEKFFENMNARGINVIPNLKPGILKHHPYIDLFEKNDVFIKTPDGKAPYYGRWWGGEGRFFDFTGEAGRNTWKQLLEENILKKGTKTVWNDNCEMDGVEDRDAQCDFEGKKGHHGRAEDPALQPDGLHRQAGAGRRVPRRASLHHQPCRLRRHPALCTGVGRR